MMPATSASETGGAGKVETSSVCDQRGFHGPLLPQETARVGWATCAECGFRVAPADHLPAYQIALFHGLIPEGPATESENEK